MNQYFKELKKQARAEQKAQAKKRPLKGIKGKNESNWKRQGINLNIVEYEELFEDQNGLCAICKTDLGNLDKTHTDHCHKTGKVRGILCPPCNLGLGQFSDDFKRLIAAAQYIIFHEEKL